MSACMELDYGTWLQPDPINPRSWRKTGPWSRRRQPQEKSEARGGVVLTLYRAEEFHQTLRVLLASVALQQWRERMAKSPWWRPWVVNLHQALLRLRLLNFWFIESPLLWCPYSPIHLLLQFGFIPACPTTKLLIIEILSISRLCDLDGLRQIKKVAAS